ncbi:hypothetical protein Agub_g1428 [Astrephomene gubernaculifera]|uniref:2'-phosphotransferase n=1 Tax=Astrephomene gubernaculifera TaxID=47775 RepID=A0AAD3DGG0_9CHLO|nr:hypothetical protein Agub_g1428 [Astrephomene gubernaculifera]
MFQVAANQTLNAFARRVYLTHRAFTPLSFYRCNSKLSRAEAYSPRAHIRQPNIANAKEEGKEAMKRRGNEDMTTRISRDMSRLLRHNPPPGAMDAAGWVSLPVLLRHLRHHPTEDQVRQVVASCQKKRFVLDDTVSPPRIRAAQGHTVELAEAILEPVGEASSVPVAVHITSVSSWEAIQGSGQLLRMKRTHIHFATQPHHLRKNKWAEVLLRLDLEAAMAQGLKFFLSSNGVLLCEGPVPVDVVRKVELEDLPEDWHQDKDTQAKA